MYRNEIGRIGNYAFKNTSLLKDALTHPSASHADASQFQRLEYLGDAVMNLVITDALLRLFPNEMEGKLSKRRAALVSKETCEKISKNLHLTAFIHADSNINIRKTSIVADALEAVIGAIYTDSDYDLEVVRKWVLHEWNALLMEECAKPAPRTDPKTALQEWTQAHRMHAPVYAEVCRIGPDHDVTLRVSVSVPGSGVDPCYGQGSTKKLAEKIAAEQMLAQLKCNTNNANTIGLVR